MPLASHNQLIIDKEIYINNYLNTKIHSNNSNLKMSEAFSSKHQKRSIDSKKLSKDNDGDNDDMMIMMMMMINLSI